MKTFPRFLWLGFVGPAFAVYQDLGSNPWFLAPWVVVELGHHA